MTAEIAIANKHAVALAADSKVTIGSGGGAKTYDTVNKVFTLSKIHPVGIMIFGNAEFMDYPWETIIKLFRAKEGARNRATVQEWSSDFQAFIAKFGKIEDDHIKQNINSIVYSWLAQVENDAVDAAIASGIPLQSDDFGDILSQFLDAAIERCESAPNWIPAKSTRKFLTDNAPAILGAVDDLFAGDDNSPNRLSAIKLAASALCHNIESPQSSGFVIAGFGDDDIFPTVIEHYTDGYVGKAIKKRVVATIDISRKSSACIRAFAQKDMVQSFMNGIDMSLVTIMTGMFAEALNDSCISVLEAYGTKQNRTEAVREKIREASTERVRAMIGEFSAESSRHFSEPIMNMVDMLPKDELASLADSLVSLTSLKRRVSSGIETVGGAIDVALISKGDGFVWIKRKHYFNTELNPQFVRNYMAGDGTRGRTP